MDENIVKFQEKLRELVSLGKKKKGILEIQEINDFFSDMELDSDQMEKVFDYLEANNVDVLRISNDDDDIPDDIVILMWRRSTFQCRMESVLKIRSVCT